MKSLVKQFFSKIIHLRLEKEHSYNSGYWVGYKKGYTEGHTEGCKIEIPPPLPSDKKEYRNCLQCQEPFYSYICQDRKYCTKKCALEMNIFKEQIKKKEKETRAEADHPTKKIKTSKPKVSEPPIVPLEPVKVPVIPNLPKIPSQYQTLEQKKARIKAFSNW